MVPHRGVRLSRSGVYRLLNEVLRMEAPIQGFSRYAVKEFDMDGMTIPADSRAIVFFGAANRDEREYPDPDRFDVRGNPANHMAFGTARVPPARVRPAGRRPMRPAHLHSKSPRPATTP